MLTRSGPAAGELAARLLGDARAPIRVWRWKEVLQVLLPELLAAHAVDVWRRSEQRSPPSLHSGLGDHVERLVRLADPERRRHGVPQ